MYVLYDTMSTSANLKRERLAQRTVHDPSLRLHEVGIAYPLAVLLPPAHALRLRPRSVIRIHAWLEYSPQPGRVLGVGQRLHFRLALEPVQPGEHHVLRRGRQRLARCRLSVNIAGHPRATHRLARPSWRRTWLRVLQPLWARSQPAFLTQAPWPRMSAWMQPHSAGLDAQVREATTW
jgi:hypothetical protein